MKKVMLALLMLMGLVQVFAQEDEMGTPFIGKTYSQQNAGRNNLLQLQQANLQDQLMDFEKTFFALENAVAQNPQSALAYLRRAQFKQRFGMISEAQVDYDKATRLNPYAGDLFSYNNPYGVLNVLSYQPGEAVIALDNAKRLEDYWNLIDDQHNDINNDPILLDKLENAVYLIEQDQEELAFLTLDSLSSEYPRSAILYDLMGMLYLRKGEIENARYMLQKALDLEPTFAIAWYNLSRVEKDLGNLFLAKQYLDTAIELRKDLSKAYFDRALISKAQGDNNAAIQDYNTVIDQNGNNYIEAYLNRGLTRKILGDFDLALNDINVAIEAYPDYAELYKNRGNLYLLFGYHNRAVEDYTIAIQKRPGYAEAIYNRGLVHFILFDRVSGCADLNTSADLGYAPANDKLKYFCVD